MLLYPERCPISWQYSLGGRGVILANRFVCRASHSVSVLQPLYWSLLQRDAL